MATKPMLVGPPTQLDGRDAAIDELGELITESASSALRGTG